MVHVRIFENTEARADRWLITPAISLPATDRPIILTFRDVAGSLTLNARYELLVSTEGAAPESFELLLTREVPVKEIGLRLIDLSAYTGQTINIAWRNISVGNTWVFLDDILIQEQSITDIDDILVSPLSIYPNPAVNTIQFTTSEHLSIQKILVYNMNGRTIKNYTGLNSSNGILDIADVIPGTYFLSLYTKNGVVNKKFVKVRP